VTGTIATLVFSGEAGHKQRVEKMAVASEKYKFYLCPFGSFVLIYLFMFMVCPAISANLAMPFRASLVQQKAILPAITSIPGEICVNQKF